MSADGLAWVRRRRCVESISDERDAGDGVFVYLRRGWADTGSDPLRPTHVIHEWEMIDLRDALSSVTRCGCADCA